MSSKIEIMKECGLEKPKVIQLLTQPSKDQLPEYQEAQGTDDLDQPEGTISQTDIDGIRAPLIRFNNFTIQYNTIQRFRLYNEFVPMVDITINDNMDIMRSLENPNTDNLLIVQILPSFDGKYKKINLTFYAYDVYVYSDTINIKGIYMVDNLHNFKMQAFGQITTYELFEKVADETKLGLAANISSTTDKRWLYCPSVSFLDLIKKEIEDSFSDEHPVTAWIDYYDNLTIVDIYEIYNSFEGLDNVWVTRSNSGSDFNSTKEEKTPQSVPPILSNKTEMSVSQLYYDDFETVSSGSSTIMDGTDRLYTYYKMDNLDTASLFVQDGDTKNDVFCKYEYAGEVSGEYDYLRSRMLNRAFVDKIMKNAIRIRLKSPVLGFYKGFRCKVEHWITNSVMDDKLNEDNEDVSNNTNTTVDEPIEQADGEVIEAKEQQIIDNQITGNYMVYDMSFEYSSDTQCIYQILTLIRPDDQKSNYIKE